MRWFILVLLLAVAVSAVTFYDKDLLVMGNIDSNATNIVCERSQRTGIVHFQKELPCCIDTDDTGYCSNDEPVLGEGSKLGMSMKYMWPTWTFKPSYSHKLMYILCEGTIIITGKEYNEFLLNNGCEQKGDVAYCCPEDVFPAKPRPTSSPTGYSSAPIKKNPILVVNKNRWAMVKKGIIRDMYVEKAVRSEKERCAHGGSDIFTFDQRLGGYFSDTKNYHAGERVFMFTKPEYDIVPLISWCE